VFELWILPIISIFFIVDPLAVIPSFLTLTADDSSSRRRRIALKAAVASTLILAGFASAGGLIFRIFGITLPAFRIAGGIILGLSALEMVRAERRSHGTREELEEGAEKYSAALTPLAIPMLAGPGAISTAIVLAGQAHGAAQSAVVYASIILTGLISYVSLRLGEPLLGRLGKTGIRVVTRIMGLILAAVAVQFVFSGVREAFR